MKTLSAMIAVLFASAICVFAQGSLTPPGPPRPTMRSLDQIEPRTPISSTPFVISSSGSYYLAHNLTVSSGVAITISTSFVELDLNGFTIAGTAASASGGAIAIASGNLTDITIKNGHIKSGVTYNGTSFTTGPGFAYGIMWLGTVSGTDYLRNIRVSNVSVSGCGAGGGINLLGAIAEVDNCLVDTVSGVGIGASTVTNCSVYYAGNRGIYAYTASNCYALSVGKADDALYASTVENCLGDAEGTGFTTGISAVNASNCTGFSKAGDGLTARTATNCFGYGGFKGVSADQATHCGGTSTGGQNGLYTEYSASFCSGSTTGSEAGLRSKGTANSCYGYNAGSGPGLSAPNAMNSYGQSFAGGDGLYAINSAMNCSGTANSSTNHGLVATSATNCTGTNTGSGEGLFATMANNCYGASAGGIGLQAYEIAIASYGYSPGGIGLQAFIANSCAGNSFDVTNKYNMP